MYQRQTGDVLIYASDHDFFDFIKPYKKYPKYTVYEFKNCHSFSEWVERIAVQWLNHIQK
ncbi:hypothetical protein D0463_02650 [Bacillus sp. V59.32b]|nr:hypothetical protein D0463_02650 [Bacillus sp. V59.32b]